MLEIIFVIIVVTNSPKYICGSHIRLTVISSPGPGKFSLTLCIRFVEITRCTRSFIYYSWWLKKSTKQNELFWYPRYQHCKIETKGLKAKYASLNEVYEFTKYWYKTKSVQTQKIHWTLSNKAKMLHTLLLLVILKFNEKNHSYLQPICENNVGVHSPDVQMVNNRILQSVWRVS